MGDQKRNIGLVSKGRNMESGPWESLSLEDLVYSPISKEFIRAARSGGVAAVQILLKAEPGKGTCPYKYLLEALKSSRIRTRDLDVMKVLFEGVHNESSRFYSPAALESAIQNQQHEQVQWLREAKKFVGEFLGLKKVGFHDAASCGDMQLVKFLLGLGIDANTDLTRRGICKSALAIASAGGHLDMMKYLISIGARLNPPLHSTEKCWGLSPLTAASKEGVLEAVEVLLRAGANVNGDLALYAAASEGHLLVVKHLLGAAADVSFGPLRPGGLSDADRITPLEKAAQGDYIQVVEVLLSAKANIGVRVLYAAAEGGSVTIVKRLIDAGADINAFVDGNHRTPLHGASQMGREDVVDLLLKLGADCKLGEDCKLGADCKPIRPWQPSRSVASPLKLAIQGGHHSIAKKLIQYVQANLHEESLPSVDTLHFAVQRGYEDIVKILLELRTPVVGEQLKHKTLVSTAASKGYTSIIRLLLDAGASLIEKASPKTCIWSPTALQAAIFNGHAETAQFLVSAGADANEAPGAIAPPLHLAAKLHSADLVKMLLDAGADPYSISDEGGTAYQASSQLEILNLLDTKSQSISRAPRYNPSLNVSTVSPRGLCTECAKLPTEAFYPISPPYSESESKMYGGNGFRVFSGRVQWAVWRPSLAYLVNSARNGCPFCMFFWRQLGRMKIRKPPSSVVDVNVLDVTMKPRTISCRTQERYPKNHESPSHLYATFCVGVEPFEDGPIPVPGDTSSANTVKQIQRWLRECLETHHLCKAHLDPKFLPTRLLDLTLWDKSRQLRLLESNKIDRKVPYIALSHRWDANYTASMATTSVNLALQLNSISPETLSLTFSQAADVTTKLGIKYLWIDSLCIVQDSMDDWAHESSLMGLIYQNSYCTISAGATKDSSKGLFHSTNMNNESVDFKCTSEDGNSRLVRATKAYPGWEQLYKDGPLHTRGWIMQERELSPRIVHYTRSEVIWECRTLKATEHSPIKDATRLTSLRNRRILDSIFSLKLDEIYDLWHHTIENYTWRQLTNTEDILPALSGLARIVGKHTGSEYVAGVWEGDIKRSLAWASDHSGMKCQFGSGKAPDYPFARHDVYVSPTWSWASVMGPTTFSALRKPLLFDPGLALYSLEFSQSMEEDMLGIKKYSTRTRELVAPDRGILVIKKHTTKLATSDPYGRVKSASLHISAAIVKGVLRYPDENGYKRQYGPCSRLCDCYGNALGNLYFDVPSEYTIAKPEDAPLLCSLQIVHCVALFMKENETVPERRRGMGLALVPVEGEEATYRRVGHIQELVYERFRVMSSKDIILV
ncbi:hypothetical protein HYFRA_00009476 [Hymenoscyphus fraxineus]|uniref:Heterokaryon incompatibility domain-containing protein n=1 Tax=Hymenoscyphus fraxineus TaxID=746836 RepID=A0A9N9PUE0_9HELO|nr:hypothetical protein HYFRA_00009476 [Hymenoscyphus fraxineus]